MNMLKIGRKVISLPEAKVLLESMIEDSLLGDIAFCLEHAGLQFSEEELAAVKLVILNEQYTIVQGKLPEGKEEEADREWRAFQEKIQDAWNLLYLFSDSENIKEDIEQFSMAVVLLSSAFREDELHMILRYGTEALINFKRIPSASPLYNVAQAFIAEGRRYLVRLILPKS